MDHGKLFSGKYSDLPGSTPDRRRLISEYIFDAKFNRLLEYTPQRDIDGKRWRVIGDNNRGGIKANLTNPFLRPIKSGVRYYDTSVLDGGRISPKAAKPTTPAASKHPSSSWPVTTAN